jgi:hypothetical protein
MHCVQCSKDAGTVRIKAGTFELLLSSQSRMVQSCRLHVAHSVNVPTHASHCRNMVSRRDLRHCRTYRLKGRVDDRRFVVSIIRAVCDHGIDRARDLLCHMWCVATSAYPLLLPPACGMQCSVFQNAVAVPSCEVYIVSCYLPCRAQKYV